MKIRNKTTPLVVESFHVHAALASTPITAFSGAEGRAADLARATGCTVVGGVGPQVHDKVPRIVNAIAPKDNVRQSYSIDFIFGPRFCFEFDLLPIRLQKIITKLFSLKQ